MTEDGIVGSATWYRVNTLFNAVKKLNDLSSEGLRLEEISSQFPFTLSVGDSGSAVRVLQYYLNYVSQFINTVPSVVIDGSFGPSTAAAVEAFQRTYGLSPDGIVGEATWNELYNAYLGFVESIPLRYTEGVIIPFPGRILKIGSEGEDVRVLQNYLNYIAATYTNIPTVNVTGYFGTGTAAAVNAFVEQFVISVIPNTVNSNVWDAITNIYQDLYFGNAAQTGQFPGSTVGEER